MPEHAQPTPTPREHPEFQAERREAAREAAARAREAWGGTPGPTRVAAFLLGLAILWAWSMMPASWPAPTRAVAVTKVAVEVRVDAVPMDGIHTIEFIPPAGTTATLVELDGRRQAVSVPEGQHGRAVFTFPGPHVHRGVLHLQTAQGTTRVPF